MLTGALWAKLDNVVFALQVGLAIFFYFRNRGGHGFDVVACGILFLHLLFLSPNTRLMFGGDLSILWRFFPLDFRPSVLFGLSIYDAILMMVVFPFATHAAFCKGRFDGFFAIASTFLLMFVVGTCAVVLRVYELDVNRFLIAVRVALLFWSFIAVGLCVDVPHSLELIKSFFLQFLALYLMGCASMLALAPSERWNRYGMVTFLPSQSFWVVSFLALLGSLFYPMSFTKRVGMFAIGMFPLWGFSKTAASIYAVSACMFLLFKYSPAWIGRLGCHRRFVAVLLLLCVASSLLTVIAFSLLVDNTGALGTRHYQLLNLWLTLTEKGYTRVVFGIGWNQWYKIIIDFPEIDYGAWDAMELNNTDFRAALQTALAPVLRGSGILGLGFFLHHLYSLSKAALPIGGPLFMRAPNFCLLLLCIAGWGAFPEIGFDAVAFYSLIIGYLVRSGHADVALPQRIGWNVKSHERYLHKW